MYSIKESLKFQEKYGKIKLNGLDNMKDFNRFLPDKPIIKNEDFAIYGGDDLLPYIEELMDILVEEKRRLQLLFGIKEFKTIEINLFCSHDAYLDFTRQFYEPAPYSYGNFTNGMINYSYNIDQIQSLKYSIRHELVHLFYESIWKDNYDRVLWLDEGLAQNFSDEKSRLKRDYNRFKSWYIDHIIRRDKEIPPLEYMREHGNTYGKFEDEETNKYSGYDLSYIMVRYLLETLSHEEFLAIIKEINKIKAIESDILPKTIEHFNQQFYVDELVTDTDNIETPSELMDYMNKNIIYGWVDTENKQHIGNLKGIRECYRINSLDTTLSLQIGTCIEQAKFIRYFLERMGFKTKLYCRRRYENEENPDEDVKMHCFVLFEYKGNWYHFEHSNFPKRGIHEYSNLEEFIEDALDLNDKDDIRVLTEIPDIPDGLTFLEFNRYVNSFEPVSLENKKVLN